MGRLRLRRDAARLAFFVRVTIEHAPGAWSSTWMLFDTGSNVSGVSARVAARREVALPRLPWDHIAVVGARPALPFMARVRLALAGDEGPSVTVDRLWILVEEKHDSEGNPDEGILGLDALSAYRARLWVDRPEREGWLEW